MPSVFKSNIILLILKNNIELVIIFRRADREYTIMTGVQPSFQRWEERIRA